MKVAMTKDELVNGYIVENSIGGRYMVFNNELVSPIGGGCYHLNEFHKDLSHIDDEDYDIVKVWGLSAQDNVFDFSIKYREMVWEHLDPMTIMQDQGQVLLNLDGVVREFDPTNAMIENDLMTMHPSGVEWCLDSGHFKGLIDVACGMARDMGDTHILCRGLLNEDEEMTIKITLVTFELPY